MEFHRKQRFSIRKYAVGVASVLIGLTLVGPMVAADTVSSEEQVQTVSVVDDAKVDLEKEKTDLVTESSSKSLLSEEIRETTTSDKGQEFNEERAVEATAIIAPKEKPTVDLPTPTEKIAEPVSSPKPFVTNPTSTQEKTEETIPNGSEVPSPNELDEATPVEALVRLKEEKESGEGLHSSELDKARRIEKTNQEHEQFLKELEKQSIRFKKLYDINLLFSGLALETTYGDAKKIRGLARVDAVDYAPLGRTRVEDSQPVPASPTPSVTKVSEENSLINLQPLWDKGIKGQGQVVAVIDSGVDPAHDIFRLTDISKAKFKSEADIEEAKKKAGISYGKWYNNKIVYVHNYSDMNDNVKEDDPISHGAHVAGTAVGNASQPSPNGEIIRGVAPEAQLMFLRVFSDTKGGQVQNFIYTKAVEDAVKLGADSINMSLGTASGSVYDVGEITRQAFDAARKAGVTITVASTNMATNGFWHSKPLASTPDYGMTGTPSVNPNVISVASINSLTKHE